MTDLRGKIAEHIEDAMVEAAVDYPAGPNCGARIVWDETYLLDRIMEEIQADAIMVVQQQPLYPDTHTGTRQKWVKDQIVEKIRKLIGRPTA